MLLMTALFQSENGIATRRKTIPAAGNWRKDRYEYHTAFVSQKGVVFIFNGRNGTIRRAEGADNLFTDWQPFQGSEFSPRKKIQRIRIKDEKLEPPPSE